MASPELEHPFIHGRKQPVFMAIEGKGNALILPHTHLSKFW